MPFFSSVSITDNTVDFLTTPNCNIAIVNALRRELMSGVNVYALHEDNVMVFSNTSSFFTEFLVKNRLALMPLKYENVNNRRLEFYLCQQKETSKPLVNTTDDIISVTLSMFQIFEMFEDGSKVSVEPEEIFLFPNMEILWLKPEQQIHLKYDGVKSGNGYEHAMYQCFRINDYKLTGKNRYSEPEQIYLSMEALGRISASNALFIVLNNILNKLNLIKTNIIDIGSGTNITMIDEHYMELSITNETFTICNILKYYIMKYLDELTGYQDNLTNLFNVSSNQTHPLKKEFKIQIQVYEPFVISGLKEFKDVLLRACDNAMQDVSSIIEEI